jgi:hypothetical protein
LQEIEVNMALSAKFSLPYSDLNDFLFAKLGEEASGMPLSVLSALARLGVDPWVEGTRLSDLPRDVAVCELVPKIAIFLTSDKCDSSEVLARAKRLAKLLPDRGPRRMMGVVASDERRRGGSPGFSHICIALILVLFGMAAFGLLPGQ